MTRPDLTYLILSHLNAPVRIFTLTLDEFSLAVIGFILLIAANQKIIVSALSLGCISGLRFFKKGAHPKILLRLTYWSLPKIVSMWFLSKAPASHLRIWRA